MSDNRSTPLNIRKKIKQTLSNVLNEMIYEKKMSLQEFRLFSCYISQKLILKSQSDRGYLFIAAIPALLGVELNESALLQ